MSFQIPGTAAPASKPTIFLISIENEPWFDEMYAQLIDALAEHAEIKRASNSTSTIRFLSSNSPSAIIITDSGITRPSSREALHKLKDYISSGGTAIFGCNFSSYIRPPDMDEFWRSAFSLPWKPGSYHRTTVHLNRRAAAYLNSSSERLKPAYSQKALFLMNVDPFNALYLPSTESLTESHVFPPGSVNHEETPVAWAKFENGWIGYIGDVNAEAGSDKVVLTMCGL